MEHDDLLKFITWCALIFGILALVAFFLQGCSDECSKEELRCRGDRIEVCDSDQNWVLDLDCGDWVFAETGDAAGLTCCEDGQEVWCCDEQI